MPGRFQVFGWDDGPELSVRWRLISDNGRQLARSPGSFAGYEEAAAAAFATRLVAPQGPVTIASATRSGWGWTMLDGAEPGAEPVAVSGRQYARRVELMESIARFRVTASVAEVATAAVVFRRGLSSDPAVGP